MWKQTNKHELRQVKVGPTTQYQTKYPPRKQTILSRPVSSLKCLFTQNCCFAHWIALDEKVPGENFFLAPVKVLWPKNAF